MVSLLRVEPREAKPPCRQRHAPQPMRRLACDIIAQHEGSRWSK
jgi:hypothetical protein